MHLVYKQKLRCLPTFHFLNLKIKKFLSLWTKKPNSLAHIHYRKLSQVFSQFEVSFAKELLILAVPFCSPSTYSYVPQNFIHLHKSTFKQVFQFKLTQSEGFSVSNSGNRILLHKTSQALTRITVMTFRCCVLLARNSCLPKFIFILPSPHKQFKYKFHKRILALSIG